MFRRVVGIGLLLLLMRIPAAEAAEGGFFSNKLNPAISLNALFLAEGQFKEGPDRGAFGLQEAELRASSIVDPYWEFHAFLVSSGEETGFEELYVLNHSLRALEFKLGRMKAHFGKHPTLHAHSFPFIRAPLAQVSVLGDEGYMDAGLEASWLSPAPWFLELTAGFYDGSDEGSLDLGGPEGGSAAWSGHLKNFWELGENTTLELGGSVLGGRAEDGFARLAAGLNLTLKEVPSTLRGRGWNVQAEWIGAAAGLAGYPGRTHFSSFSDGNIGGGYLHAQFQLTRRWWSGFRFDADNVGELERFGLNLALAPSEFSALRAEWNTTDFENEILLQFNFTVGPHRAHAY